MWPVAVARVYCQQQKLAMALTTISDRVPPTVDVFRHPDEFPADVAAFFAAAEMDNFEFGADWYRNFVDHVDGVAGQARFFVLRQGNAVTAALPLLQQRGSFPLRRELKSLANYYTALYSPLLSATSSADELALLLKSALRLAGSPDSLTFRPLDPQAPAYQLLLQALRLAGLPAYEFFCFGNWYEPVRQTWPAYLAERDGKIRSTIKRMGKKFAAEGGELTILTDAGDIERMLDDYQSVYGASWKQAEPHVNFIPGLISLCARKGWLRMGVARLQGRAIGAQLWMVAQGKVEIYKLAYDEAYKGYSPGTLLTQLLMQHVFEHDAAVEIDYLIGDDDYKRGWMSQRRERWGIIAFNPRTLGGLAGLAREALGRMARRFKTQRSSAAATTL